MTEKTSIDELDLSDAQLIKLMRQHGFGRRTVMKVLGVGSALSLGVGSAAGRHDDSHPPRIDSYYGYSAPEEEDLPGRLCPDHTVALYVDQSAFSPESTTDLPFFFDPMGLRVDEGDIIRFDFNTPEHTVTAYHVEQHRQQRVPDGVPPFTSPVINAQGFWLYEFDSPGLYDVFCAPHEFFGMVMRIVVGDPDETGYDSSFSEEGRPPITRSDLSDLGISSWPYPTPAEVFETDALEESNIVAEGSVPPSAVEDDLGS